MKEPEVLLAKTPKNRANPQWAETLEGHSQATVDSFRALFGTIDSTSRLIERCLHFFKLEGCSGEFWINGVVTCALHDIGKANSGFQQAVCGNRDAQIIRHEHLSGLILMLPEIRDWLKEIPLLNLEIVLCTVIGHHLKVDKASFGKKLSANLDTFSVYPYGIHEAASLIASQNENILSMFPLKAIPEIWSFRKMDGCFDLRSHREQVIKHIAVLRRRLQAENETLRMLMAVRVALILADSAGSGLMREGKHLESWIGESFKETLLLNGQAVEEKVIQPRVRQITNESGSFKWQKFQNKAEVLGERALLISSCGSGKTLAAWRWIKGQTCRPVARVIFLYPTRGTATEGFRDYVSWAPEADAALMHETAGFD